MKKDFFSFGLLIVLSACQPIPKPSVDKNLTQEERHFVERYQTVLSDYLNDSIQLDLNQELKNIIKIAPAKSENPKVLHLKTDLYMQLGQFNEALQSNNALFYIEPRAENRYMRCTLLEVLKKSEKDIHTCYHQTAQLYKKAMSRISSRSKDYIEQNFFYHLSMLQAGHHNFDDKIKTLLNELPDDAYEDYHEQYLTISDPMEYQSFIRSIRDGQRTYINH